VNRLLQRQLKKLHLLDTASPSKEQWQQFVNLVDKAYIEADQNRYTLERSLNITSDEMQSLYDHQKSSYEARLFAILDAIPDIIFLIDEDGRYIEIMSGRDDRLLAEKELLLGKLLHEVLPEDQADKFLSVITEAISKEKLIVIDYEMDVITGKRYFQGRALPTKLSVEGKRTVVFVAVDITDIRQAEIQQRLISTMFESGQEGMIILDEYLKAVSANHAYGKFMRQDVNTIKGDLPLFISDKSILSSDLSIENELKKHHHWVGEINGHDDLGRAYPIWLTINEVQDEQGNLTNYVAILTDVSEIKKSQQELEFVATHDFLTALPNRVLFQDRLEQAVARSQRTNQLGALFFLDLNRFKLINDNLGHHVGDELLRQVATRLKNMSRDTDTLSRLGGDEFTLTVEGLKDINEAAVIAEKIMQVFTETFTLGEYDLEVNVSIGISVFPDDSTDVADLIKFADTAMYSAKEEGSSGYRFYTQELSTTAFEFFSMEMSLKKAISKDQFFLLYQPQYEIISGKLIGVEALIRWQHPDLGVVSPSMFIHIAETTNLIYEIGDCVMRKCCQQLKEWNKEGHDDFIVALNISRKQLVDPEFSTYVAKILQNENTDSVRLEFEITESAIMDKEYVAIENLKKLDAMGIGLAIDDFGTGYSSLENLKSFPLTRLKIDRNFVRDVNRDKDDEAIIRATIALGHSFGLKVIAEGVENSEQLAFLKAEGCDEVQGYYFSKPVSADEIKFNIDVN